MEPQEVRIGNLISFKGLWNGRVSSIHESGVVKIKGNDGVFDIEGFEPIDVTPQVMEKIGAAPFPDGESTELNGHLFWFADCTKEYVHKSSSVRLSSVHQLQNLFYALTGKELEINNEL